MNCKNCISISKLEVIATQGRVAVPGCVRGPVRVINNPRKVDQLVTGEVLVTVMTDPDCLPAIQRAVAVVTDHGGTLCHAAVVCRELGKPCIVGTHDATAALKNGTNVRVCATRGVVIIECPSRI